MNYLAQGCQSLEEFLVRYKQALIYDSDIAVEVIYEALERDDETLLKVIQTTGHQYFAHLIKNSLIFDHYTCFRLCSIIGFSFLRCANIKHSTDLENLRKLVNIGLPRSYLIKWATDGSFTAMELLNDNEYNLEKIMNTFINRKMDIEYHPIAINYFKENLSSLYKYLMMVDYVPNLIYWVKLSDSCMKEVSLLESFNSVAYLKKFGNLWTLEKEIEFVQKYTKINNAISFIDNIRLSY